MAGPKEPMWLAPMQERSFGAFLSEPPPGLCAPGLSSDEALGMSPTPCSNDTSGVTKAHQAHLIGECKPCAYFWGKADGCRSGSQCEFCHVCDREAMRKWKKAKKHQKRTEAADARLAARGKAKRSKAAGKREAAFVEHFRPTADEPARVCVNASPPRHSSTHMSAEAPSQMPLHAGVMNRPYFPTEVLMKLKISASPLTPSTNSGSPAEKLLHGVILEPFDLMEPCPQAVQDALTTRAAADPMSLRLIPSPYLLEASAMSGLGKELLDITKSGSTQCTCCKRNNCKQDHAFRNNRVPYW